MKGCLTLVVGAIVLTIVIGAAGSGSGSSSRSPTAASPTPAVKVASHPDPMRHCDSNITANRHTSCGFAERTFVAYAQAHERDATELTQAVTPISPVTGKSYEIQCQETREVGEQVVIECTGAASAKVEFPLKAAVAYAPPGQTTPAETSGEEDEVGSSSHAGDAKFCEEHTCIGSFTTEEGEVVECTDGTFSHAGGISGACSDHGGESDSEE